MNTRYLFILLIALAQGVYAQEQTFEVPATNSRSTVTQRLAATDIEVAYNRPNVKGRVIFGDLVPYGKVWRTGSDASTKITFSTSVWFNGLKVNSGTYELFTIPGKDEWTIILQQNKSQWGSYSYNQENDVLRTTVKANALHDMVETFTIGFGDIMSNSAILALSWENVMVPVKITVDLKETVLPQLEVSLQKEGKKPYFKAAMFYFENNLGIDRAAELMAMAIKENPDHIGMLYRQALILERKGDVNEAIAASEHSLEQAQKAPEELKTEYIKLNTVLLTRLRGR
ncbi:MAG: DUF2911 domain-containing protein [Flavobacteriales bacterium]|nr:DUF2911 domain-containing protein [Flavobacteriales bacterium]